MRGFRQEASAWVASSGGRGWTSVERRRGGAGGTTYPLAASGAAADGFGGVGGGAYGAPNRSSCMGQ